MRTALDWARSSDSPQGPPVAGVPPCYFNPGCCSPDERHFTALEIADDQVRLVRWRAGDGEPKPLVSGTTRSILAARLPEGAPT
jgi:hypothetical protein